MVSRPAFTLVELLAVIVILGLVATIGTTSVMRVAHVDDITEAVERLQALDHDARRDVHPDGTVERLRSDGADLAVPSANSGR